MTTILEAALAYARRGWRVLPVVHNSKIPATQRGVHDATTDEARIQAWFGSESGSRLNIGIAAGRESGLVVFDVDPRNGGDVTWDMWTQFHGNPPDGPVQCTAGGGMHYLAHYEEGIRSSKLADGLDLLADGRYFLAYPSQIDGRTYSWDGQSPVEDEHAKPFSLPNNWAESVKTKHQAAVPVNLADGLVRGNRNAGLTALAGAMRRYGLTEAEIHAALVVVNEQRCEIPLPASEVRAIAHSVARYEAESDVASDMALGDAAIEELLAAQKATVRDYYLTRGTAFLAQPTPVEWAIRGWVPAAGTTMVYGESGSGKTFLTLDWACHVAAGMPWCGARTVEGVAVYLAGEGNFGLRQRVAAWAKKHGRSNLDRLLVSNRAMDFDANEAVSEVLRAVRDCTQEKVAILVIDTVNNHMAGDENLAKDVRALFGAVNTVAAALGCPVVLNHHLGHGENAQRRARGSSAFKASLDSSILVENREGAIALTCTKMKDGPSPEPMHGRLEPVALDWVDADGQPVAGAVFVQSEAPPDTREQDRAERAQDRAQAKLEKWRGWWERAWWNAGAELVSVEGQERPYLSRAALRDWLTQSQRSMTSGTIEQHLKPSAREGMMVRDLTDTGYLEPYQDGHGWTVVDQEHVTALLLSRDARVRT